MESKIGLIIQFSGILLMTALSLLLRRSLKTRVSTLWSISWTALSFALFCLSFAFISEGYATPLYVAYFFGEYVFGITLLLGCRALSDDFEVGPKHALMLIPFGLLAVALPLSLADFSFIFNLHALLLTTFFVVAFAATANAKIKGFGWRTMRVALALLAIDFFHYFFLFALLKFEIRLPVPQEYLAFNPVIDLVLEVMLGFGMVITLLENVLHDMRIVNRQLQEAHEKLEQTAHVDPLTTALNRHAFYGFLRKNDRESTDFGGCVGFFDIDDLKPINDQLGHSVGDMAIRAVVNAIRDLIRAEDLIYRWGGDEFFVVLVSMDAEMAAKRMETLERRLTDIFVEGSANPLTIRVSYGFRDFGEMAGMERAIKEADEEMYRRKQERKLRRRLADANTFLSNENIRVSADGR